jgi:hypothetical protein
VASEVVYDNSDQADADPGENAANDFRLCRTEHPAQVVAPKVAENTESFEPEYPARMEAYGEVEIGGPGKGKTQRGAEEKKPEDAGQKRQRLEKRRESEN